MGIIHREIQTAISHLTQIAVHFCRSRSEKSRNCAAFQENTAPDLLKQIDHYIQSVIKLQIDTDIEFFSGFPSDLLILETVVNGTAQRILPVGARRISGSGKGEVRHVHETRLLAVVAHKTVRTAEFEIRDGLLDRRPKFLLTDHVSHGHRREKAEAPSLGEILTAVVSEIGLDEVTVVVPVGQTARKALFTLGQRTEQTTGISERSLLLIIHDHSTHVMTAETAVIVDHSLDIYLAVSVSTAGGGECRTLLVAADLQIIVFQSVIARMRTRNFVGIITCRTRCLGIGIVLERDQRRSGKPFGDEIEILIQTQIGVQYALELVFVAGNHFSHGILHHGFAAPTDMVYRRIVGKGYRHIGGIAVHDHSENVFAAFHRPVRIPELGVDFQRHFGRLRKIDVDIVLESVTPNRVIVVIGEVIPAQVLQHTFLVTDGGAHEVIDPRTAAADIEVKVFVDCQIFKHLIVPIHIRIDIFVAAGPRTVDLRLRIRNLPRTARQNRLVVHLHVGHRIDRFRAARRSRKSRLEAKINDRLIQILTVLRRNDHHAVGSPRTIESGRRSILEHRKTLDNLRVQPVQFIRVDSHTVKDDQRLGRGTERGDTAYPEIRLVGTGLSIALHGDHTGQASGKPGRQTRRRHPQFRGSDGLYRAHQHAFLLLAVTHHHNFVQRIGVLFQRHVEIILTANRNLLGFIPDIGEKQCFPVCRQVDRKHSVQVRRSTDGHTFYLYGGSDQRLSGGRIGDSTGNRSGSRLCIYSARNRENTSGQHGEHNQPRSPQHIINLNTFHDFLGSNISDS